MLIATSDLVLSTDDHEFFTVRMFLSVSVLPNIRNGFLNDKILSLNIRLKSVDDKCINLSMEKSPT